MQKYLDDSFLSPIHYKERLLRTFQEQLPIKAPDMA